MVILQLIMIDYNWYLLDN